MENKKKRILIVEDDGSLRSLYVDLLEQAGFTVDQAVEGKEGLTKLLQGGYDLALLDILLPGLEGPEILEKLQQQKPSKSNASIVMLTNQDEQGVLKKCQDLGAKGVIIKSKVSMDQFVEAVKKFLS